MCSNRKCGVRFQPEVRLRPVESTCLKILFLAGGVILAGDVATAQPITFRKIADTDTPIPGGVGTFAAFTGHPGEAIFDGLPALGDGAVAFGGFDASDKDGLYLEENGTLRVIVDTNTPIPGGSGNFFRLGPVAFYDGVAAFSQRDMFSRESGVYTWKRSDASLDVVVRTGDPHPGGTGVFNGVFPPVSTSGGFVAFQANSSVGPAIYTNVGGVLNVVADVDTAIPGGTGNFSFFGAPGALSLDAGSVAFRGGAQSQVGIYTDLGGLLSVVADTNTPAPGGVGNFTSFGRLSLDAGVVAFIGNSEQDQRGIYLSRAGVLQLIANRDTPVPGNSGHFEFFNRVSLDNENVAFSAFIPGLGSGTYAMFDGTLIKVVAPGDLLDGKLVTLTAIGDFRGREVAFRAFFGDDFKDQGIFVATIVTVCGNGTVEQGETCDDGNTTDGDGCSSTCRIENPIPAVSHWGLIAMVLLALATGTIVARRCAA